MTIVRCLLTIYLTELNGNLTIAILLLGVQESRLAFGSQLLSLPYNINTENA